MEIPAKELLKQLLSRKHTYNKAYQSMVMFYKIYFDNLGFQAGFEIVQKDLEMELNFHAAYYAYKKIYSGKKKGKTGNTHFGNNPPTSTKTEEKKYKDASDILANKSPFGF